MLNNEEVSEFFLGLFYSKLILSTLANKYYLYPKEIILNIEVNDIEHYVFSYTGHEHLLEFKIINMNGRMYDPVLGRMLSPDNYVQDPNNPQNYNRYAYCPNNPLIYTDPDGEWIHLVVGAVIGGIAGTITGLNNGARGWLNEVYNSGAMKIKHSSFSQLQWDNYYKSGGSFWRLLPQRYNYNISLYNFR